jgi:hypothetical protein
MSNDITKSASDALQLIAGIQKHPPATSSVVLGGKTYTMVQLEASLQALADLHSDVAAARATTKAKVATQATEAPPLRSLAATYRAYVKVTYGNAPDILADFGIAPTKAKTPLTIEQRRVVVAKSAATRAARHTMGKAQKKAVKGTITTIVTPPSTTAPAPVAARPTTPSGV